MNALSLRVAALVALAGAVGAQDSVRVGDSAIAAALERAGENASQIRRALDEAGDELRPAMRFLVAHMPGRDLRALQADFLLEDVRLAFDAWRSAPWAAQVPEEVFLDAVLPYASVTETREPWRARLRETALSIVADCASPGEAAQALNRELFAAVGVKYSTARARADQSPSESIEQGVASCTGLSILLVDACRAVGVPARLVGIAEWPNKKGNHTWVEVWDGERWRFTGAAEYDPKGLDRAWFTADAALATSEDPRHAVWAVTWRRTGARFPLAWAPDAEVHAEDVTARYARGEVADEGLRLMVDVRDGVDGPRVAAHVELVPADGGVEVGTSKGEGADTNDHLEFRVPRGSTWRVRVRYRGRTLELEHAVRGETQEIVTVHLPAAEAGETELWEGSRAFFAATGAEREEVAFGEEADALVAVDEELARSIVWDAYRSACAGSVARADFDEHVVRTADREAEYTVRQVGSRPAGGFGLVIAMHGGGGVAKPVNDQQWRVMQRYYKDHPEVGGYLYVALRAPNDAWNGFYDDAICPLIDELIRQFLVFGDVDPDKVFAIGYSHGGYGAFVIGSKTPDRFAAVHASAAAPTPGETVARNLRNLRFRFMVGSRDAAYGRIERCDAFAKEIEALRAKDPDGYPVTYERIEGNGHTGLPDRDALATLCLATRDPVPRVVSWRPTDGRITDHLWIHVPEPADGQAIDAHIEGDTIRITTEAVGALSVCLDRRLIGDAATITIDRDGTTREVAYAPRARTLCESLARRGDPELAFPMEVDLPRKASN